MTLGSSHRRRFETVGRERVVQLLERPRQRRRQATPLVVTLSPGLAQTQRRQAAEVQHGVRRPDAPLGAKAERETIGGDWHFVEHERERRGARR